MDFISRFPKTKKVFMVVWITVDRLTKSTHLIPRKTTYLVDNLAHLHGRNYLTLWSTCIYNIRLRCKVHPSLLEESIESTRDVTKV